MRLQAQTPDKLDYQVGPYRFDMFADSLGPLQSWANPDRDRIGLFGFAAEDFRAVKDSQPLAFESVRGGVTGEPFEDFTFFGGFVLDEELAKDPSYSGKKWRGLAGDVDQAFACYSRDRFTAIAGRFGGFWGTGRSLVFAPEQKLDGFGYSVRWGRLGLSYRIGALDGLSPDADSVAQYEPRWVAAHRFDLHLSDAWRIGLFETVVFGGPGRQIDPFYLNPLIFMHGSQLNENLNDNTMVGVDFDFQAKRVLLYGQALVDDLQVDNKEQSDKEPNQIGLLLGGYFTDLFDLFDVQASYERVSNWTFNQVHPRNRYLNDSRPIGNVLGNDYDRATLELVHWWHSRLNSSVNLAYTRRGEGQIEADWTEPWMDVEGDYSEPFPTGTVQKTASVALGLSGYLTDFAFADFEAGVDFVKNYGHAVGDDRDLPFVRLYLSTFLLSALNVN